MQLKRYTDYALRVPVYLAVQPDDLCRVARITDACCISRNHLVKVNAGRSDLGLETRPARVEGNTPLVDCAHLPCPIVAARALSRVPERARRTFLDTLHLHTVSDLPDGRIPGLVRLLNTAERNPLP